MIDRNMGNLGCSIIAAFVLAASGAHAADALPNLQYDSLGGEMTSFSTALLNSQVNEQICAEPREKCSSVAPDFSQIAHDRFGCGGHFIFGWRSPTALDDGKKFVEKVEAMAADRRLFDCSRQTCLVMLEASPTVDDQSNIKSYSLCRLITIDDTVGPPHHCREVVKENGETFLIKSVLFTQPSASCMMGLPDFDVSFNGKKIDYATVRKLAHEILENWPLSLVVTEESIGKQFDILYGVRSFLPSNVLSGWREWTTVIIQLYGDSELTGMIISTNILVSKQNTTERASWTPASEQQQFAYLSILRRGFVKQGGVVSLRHRQPPD